ncbi:MAG: insulinase family protein [Bacteroidetes bacterium]|nr:MAG: insulinase family protein [Bacteroidota bacterium]
MKHSRNTIGKLLFILTTLLLPFLAVAGSYSYTTVPGDPMNTRIYELDNGLKVYLTVYENEPRVHTSIAVRAGSKHDPHEDTGLAHYLEHLMFKGTDRFGSLDWEKEKVYLNKIDSLFEVHRRTEDEAERSAIYRVIDSVSYEASKYAIPNEYDRMLSLIGARGTNAYTSVEQTVYINDVPANQLERWLTIESERFRNPIFRLFHTELETVYEEKNMSLDNDGRKVFDKLYEILYPDHTYGTQTTLGSQEHLKNPSIRNIRDFYNTYYVPNNMAIIISGDFDPDELIVKIDNHFGHFEPGDVPAFTYDNNPPQNGPFVAEVFGPSAETIRIGWRLPGVTSREADIVSLMSGILSNGTAGLIDINVNQAQTVLRAGAFTHSKEDYSSLQISATPKSGQTLEEVRDILLAEVENLKTGNFPDWLPEAVINDMKLSEIRTMQSNNGRTRTLVNAFTSGVDLETYVDRFNRWEKITKEDIVAFANAYLDNNYAVVYKRKGTDESIIKLDKPLITPVVLNRDHQSDFFGKISQMEVESIEPVFLDYKNDISEYSIHGNIPLYYNRNVEDETFTLYYLFDMGNNHDQKLGLAIRYLEYLGTDKYSPEEVKQQFYRTGTNFNVFNSNEQVYVFLSGLSENMEAGLKLFEELLNEATANDQALENLKRDILRQRENNKLNKNYILRTAMFDYAMYGEQSPLKNILSEEELMAVTSDELIDRIHNLTGYEHRVLYYGTHQPQELISLLEKHRKLPPTLRPLPEEVAFTEVERNQTEVFVVDFDMTQVDLMMLSKASDYQEEKIPTVNLFNSYFGTGMSAIVFQELREAKGLAYSAFAFYTTPSRPDRSHYIYTFIGTQSDKLSDAMQGMSNLLEDMPVSENSFHTARESIIERINTERITRTGVLFNYETAKRMGRDYDIRRKMYEEVPKMEFNTIQEFHNAYVKDSNYAILVLGKQDELDIEALEEYGKVHFLTLEQVFGY